MLTFCNTTFMLFPLACLRTNNLCHRVHWSVHSHNPAHRSLAKMNYSRTHWFYLYLRLLNWTRLVLYLSCIFLTLVLWDREVTQLLGISVVQLRSNMIQVPLVKFFLLYDFCIFIYKSYTSVGLLVFVLKFYHFMLGWNYQSFGISYVDGYHCWKDYGF